MKFWKCKVVPSAHVTAWRVLENKLATKANLEKRGITVVSSLYSLCGVEEESHTHMFFECSFAWRVWNLCCAWLGVQTVFHNVPLLNFSQFRLSNESVSVNEVWGVIWIAVVNEIWKHRNRVIFRRGVIDVLEVFALVQLKAWAWVTSKSQDAIFSFSDWCIDPLVCMEMMF
ncbi:uncharacterized protein [Phaseolus vulgaris]|uniref:uncharacterized protein n=1 Tax=Phaseolus vulgaris TaxID=3885 RepID=UPI0035CABACA